MEAPETGSGVKPVDPRENALAVGLEISKKCLQATSSDTLHYILTNDLRLLVEFDRALLITHMGGRSRFVAATNHPELKQKSEFFQETNRIAADIAALDRAVFLRADVRADQLSREDLPPEIRDRLLDYVKSSKCSLLLVVPLPHPEGTVGHLLLEFYEQTVPDNIRILTLLGIAPVLGSASVQTWLSEQEPKLRTVLFPRRDTWKRGAALVAKMVVAAAVAAVFVFVLFFVPVDRTVGGEAEIVPKTRHMAFVKIPGVVKQINVREGDEVAAGDVLAELDGRELEQEMKRTQRRLTILKREIALLRRESDRDPSKLAEVRVLELKAQGALAELEYLQWKSRFLTVKAPVAGVAATRDISSLVGKRFEAGEPFCEITVPGELEAAIFVPEERISGIEAGQNGSIYLSSEPSRPYPLTVRQVGPTAEVMPRLGNVYRVTARMKQKPDHAKAGMKGIGKIVTGTTTISDIIGRRILARWNKFSLRFQ